VASVRFSLRPPDIHTDASLTVQTPINRLYVTFACFISTLSISQHCRCANLGSDDIISAILLWLSHWGSSFTIPLTVLHILSGQLRCERVKTRKGADVMENGVRGGSPCSICDDIFKKRFRCIRQEGCKIVTAVHNRQVTGSNFIILLCHSSGIINGFTWNLMLREQYSNFWRELNPFNFYVNAISIQKSGSH